MDLAGVPSAKLLLGGWRPSGELVQRRIPEGCRGLGGVTDLQRLKRQTR